MKRRVEKAARREAAAGALVVGKEEGSTALAAAPGPGSVRLKTHQTTNPHKGQAVPNCLARKETGRERRNSGDGQERKGESECTGKFPSGQTACLFRSILPTLEEPSQKSSDDRM